MGFGQFLQASPNIRPYLNLGCLLDIPTGKYHTGKHGESILNGGLSYVTGVGGRGNTYKSTLAHFMNLRSLDRYLNAHGSVYDCEPPSVTPLRMTQLAAAMENIAGEDLVDAGRLLITDSTMMLGNEWFAQIKNFCKMKTSKEHLKQYTGTTPFIDKNGNAIKSWIPSIVENDSLSMMPIEVVENIYDKNEIGASGANVEALKSSGAKSQMLMQTPHLTGSSGLYMIFTAHAGDDLALDPYAPPQKKLTFLKNKLKFKQVPEKFTFLTNNLWLCLNAQVLQNQSTKGPEYPRDPNDNLKGDTDLQLITVMNLRAKNGPSGLPFELIASQSEGILVGLSEFNYIKSSDRFGLGGHDRSYFLELVPDVAMQRTTVRSKIREHASVQRALEITSELCQITNLWHDVNSSLLCGADELYAKLKEKGYDWDLLLNTRGYWVYDEAVTADTKPFLSTMDLLKMRVGDYHPWWYNDVAKAAGKPTVD